MILAVHDDVMKYIVNFFAKCNPRACMCASDNVAAGEGSVDARCLLRFSKFDGIGRSLLIQLVYRSNVYENTSHAQVTNFRSRVPIPDIYFS